MTTNHARTDVVTTAPPPPTEESGCNEPSTGVERSDAVEAAEFKFGVDGDASADSVLVRVKWPTPDENCVYTGALAGSDLEVNGIMRGDLAGTLTGTGCPGKKVTINAGYEGSIIVNNMYESLYDSVVGNN